MQHEQYPTINDGEHRVLKSAIFGAEISSLPPEYAAMFEAENDACFTHFLDTLDGELHQVRGRAEDGDVEAALILADAYREFRDLFESELVQTNPDAYRAFIEAVAEGNTSVASAIANDHYTAKTLASSAIIDDELDAQFT